MFTSKLKSYCSISESDILSNLAYHFWHSVDSKSKWHGVKQWSPFTHSGTVGGFVVGGGNSQSGKFKSVKGRSLQSASSL